jgi:hypothetical protein
MAQQTSAIYLYHQEQKTPGGAWNPSGGWGPLADRIYDLVGQQTELVTARNRDGRLELFVYLRSNSFGPINLQLWQTAASSETWKSGKGGAPISGNNIAVAQNADGRLEAFWTDAAHNLHHTWQSSASKGPWQAAAFAGQATSLTLIENSRGLLELFYIGMDSFLYHQTQTAPNSQQWTALSKFAYQGKQVAAGVNVGGRSECVFIGLDQKIYSVSEFSPGATQWHYGACAGSARAISSVALQADQRLSVAFIGIDNGNYLIHQATPGGGPWQLQSFGGGSTHQALYNFDGKLDLFYVGMDSGIYRKTQASPNSGSWLPDQHLDNALGLNVAVGLNADGRLKLFYQNVIPARLPPDGPGSGDPGGGSLDPMPGGGDVDQPDQ